MSYIPFVIPLHQVASVWYLLIIPLAFGISMVYKAMRLPTLEHYWRNVVIMTFQIVLAMIGLAIMLLVVVQYVIPILPAE